MNISHC